MANKIEDLLNNDAFANRHIGSSNEQKKKTRNDDSQSRQKTESEIIQDALEIFGGIVVK